MTTLIPVLLHTPAYSALAGPLAYLSDEPLAPGTLVRVPLGTEERLGVVWDAVAGADPAQGVDPSRLRPITMALGGLPALNAPWRQLVGFVARYYQRSAGEVALSALPPQLRTLTPKQWAKRKPVAAPPPAGAQGQPSTPSNASKTVVLSAQQMRAIGQFHANPGPFLLFGATGSGKTEVFMHCAADVLAQDAQAQVLVMVPEINLTPQLEALFSERFVPHYGAQAVVSLHSGMTPAQRLRSWLAAHTGVARVVLGTRMAVLASLPGLRLLVVDEEHDPSYKSGEGARYSARDLAVFRGQIDGAKVILASATPSLESWHHSRPAAQGGRYQRLEMPLRVGADPALPLAGLPRVRRVDMNHQPKGCVLAPPLVDAMAQRVARGEQSMVLLNRRGYAPVLSCTDCDWKSTCPHCSAYRVFHKVDGTLRCHHCGFSQRVPRACPDCGNPDIVALGRGTERLEEQVGQLLAGICRPDGSAVRVARIDADTTRLTGALQAQLAQVHAGEVDVLVGTQMIAKGHDFRRITLVAAVQPDAALFSQDFRAAERLFALLMQAAGRAGRDAASAGAEMWIQTHHPTHPLFEALVRHDYPAFAQAQLQERAQAGMPPFRYQALVRAEGRSQSAVLGFLNAALLAAQSDPELAPALAQLDAYPAVPQSMQRVANMERAQMLLESASRSALQQFLTRWQATLHATRSGPVGQGVLRWAIDVDPLLI
jgi:primosomal protein N' (replication factor Y)